MSSQTVIKRTDRDAYLSNLLAQVSQIDANNLAFPWLKNTRERALAFLQEQTFPTSRDEDWRFTDLTPLLGVSFSASKSAVNVDINSSILPEADQCRLVFVNGNYAENLSNLTAVNHGLFVGNLSQVPPEYLNRVQELLGQQQGGEEVFTALNTVGFTDLAVIFVPKNAQVEIPLHLLFVSGNNDHYINQPRCLIVADSGSKITLIEEFITAENSRKAQFTNGVTEIWIGENAQVNHTRIQRENADSFHIGKTAIAQARYSHYTGNAINLGAGLSRYNLDVWQTGEGTETNLNGLTMIGGEQLSDTHSAIALNYPHGTTRQLHKCIIDDRGHAVFNGKVNVPKAAQLTDAGQLNRNLLLSSKARIDTKPQLEITADNVKCSHGATISQLEDDEIFYLQSRGLDSNIARTLLINAFATEIIQLIPMDSVQKMLSDRLLNR
jgi:Fe-S cluster assembly protein SufD